MHRTQRAICSSIMVAALICGLAPALGVRAERIGADIAPPQQAPGGNISPDKPTKVQMLSERVVIEVLRVKGKGREDLPIAQVTASFNMRNAGSADETMTVRFPLTDPGGQGDGFGGFPEIQELSITVDGKPVPYKVVTTPNPEGADKPPVKWAAFDVTFPAGKDVDIEVSYLLESTGYMPYGTFRYILEIGRRVGWADRLRRDRAQAALRGHRRERGAGRVDQGGHNRRQ